MRAISIHDLDGNVLSFDLADILRELEPWIAGLMWRITELWCVGEATPDLEEACNTGALIETARLSELAAGLLQTIDGKFAGYRAGASDPFVVVRAVDSGFFDVQCQDDEAIAKLETSFQNTRDITEQYR